MAEQATEPLLMPDENEREAFRVWHDATLVGLAVDGRGVKAGELLFMGWIAGRDWARNQKMLAQVEENRQQAATEHSDAP